MFYKNWIFFLFFFPEGRRKQDLTIGQEEEEKEVEENISFSDTDGVSCHWFFRDFIFGSSNSFLVFFINLYYFTTCYHVSYFIGISFWKKKIIPSYRNAPLRPTNFSVLNTCDFIGSDTVFYVNYFNRIWIWVEFSQSSKKKSAPPVYNFVLTFLSAYYELCSVLITVFFLNILKHIITFK